MIGIWILRTLSVWIVTEAWWQCASSVLSLEINQKWMAAVLFLFSAVWNGIFLSSRRKYLVPAVTAGTMAAVVWGIFTRNEVFEGTLNHIANAYMRLGARPGQELDLYREAGAAIFQRTMVTAVFMLPLAVIFAFILWRQKGGIFALLLMVVPVLLPALKTGFPGMWECWKIVLAAGLFFSLLDVKGGKEGFQKAFASMLVLIILVFISAGIGGKIETKRKQEGNKYYKVRSSIQTNIIKPIETWMKVKETEKKREEEEKDKKAPETTKPEEEHTDGQPEPDDPITMPWDDEGVEEWGTRDNGMKNLAGISAFVPNNNIDIEVTVDEKPSGTYYHPLWYGFTYYDSVWNKIPVNEAVQDTLFYTSYSDELYRLISLCKENPCGSPEEVTEFIDREFEENTVYDYTPGQTPEGMDFAEYFLFENKKGFCVHFATTATLIYRIYGIKARYAEGYAIPERAFVRRGDGTYTAKVTGEMGHAWCEIYDGEWMVREHTLPYEGSEGRPAIDTKKSIMESPAVRRLVTAFWVILITFVVMAVFFLQAAVRRKKRIRSYRRTSREAGIRNMYQSIYDTAVFSGMEKGHPLDSQTLEQMKNYCKSIPEEELKWLKATVQEIMFYEKIPTKEDLEKTIRIHETFTRETRKKLHGLKKLRYRYISCLG